MSTAARWRTGCASRSRWRPRRGVAGPSTSRSLCGSPPSTVPAGTSSTASRWRERLKAVGVDVVDCSSGRARRHEPCRRDIRRDQLRLWLSGAACRAHPPRRRGHDHGWSAISSMPTRPRRSCARAGPISSPSAARCCTTRTGRSTPPRSSARGWASTISPPLAAIGWRSGRARGSPSSPRPGAPARRRRRTDFFPLTFKRVMQMSRLPRPAGAAVYHRRFGTGWSPPSATAMSTRPPGAIPALSQGGGRRADDRGAGHGPDPHLGQHVRAARALERPISSMPACRHHHMGPSCGRLPETGLPQPASRPEDVDAICRPSSTPFE